MTCNFVIKGTDRHPSNLGKNIFPVTRGVHNTGIHMGPMEFPWEWELLS